MRALTTKMILAALGFLAMEKPLPASSVLPVTLRGSLYPQISS